MAKPIKPLELAQLAGVSKSTVYRWLETVHLTRLRHGKHYRRMGRRWVILCPESFIREFSG